MDPKKFFSLSDRQKQVVLIGIEVRNNMEDFHVKYLSDTQMKELNPIIRQGIMNGIELWAEYKRLQRTMKPKGILSAYVGWDIMTIPDYWEPSEEKHYSKAIKLKEGVREENSSEDE